MRYIHLPLLLALSLCAVSVHADAFSCTSERSQQVDSDMVRAQTAYSKLTSLQARFLQESYLAALDTSETSTGMMWYERTGKMRWDYYQPEEQIFLLEDNTIRFYQVAEKQVLVQSFSDVFLSDLPVAFLLGVGDLSKSFVLTKECQTPEGILLFLSPQPKEAETADRELTSFELLVEPTNFEPLGARVRDVSGNTTKIVLSERQRNLPLPSSTFTLSYPPGTDVQDRRENAPS